MSKSPFRPHGDDRSANGDGRRLCNVVSVRFAINHVAHRADAGNLRLIPGDKVIVVGEHGPAPAEVTSQSRRELVAPDKLLRVLRRATAADEQRQESHRDYEARAYRLAIKRIKARNLKMKLVRTEAIHDGSRLVFYFSADQRVDFRGLVRDLASEFRTRIEMVQVGVRDGTQMIGGIGPCGRELCCSTFLDHFQPISIRMAKRQGLTLSPSKISGMCGRLMCCLVYEQKVYQRLKRGLPKKGQQVMTSAGPASVQEVDVINQRVTVRFDSGESPQTLAIDQLIDAAPSSGPGDEGPKELWPDGPPRKPRAVDDDRSD